MTLAAHRGVSDRIFLKTFNGAWLLKACPLRLKTQRKQECRATHMANFPARTKKKKKIYICVFVFVFDNAYYFEIDVTA